MPHLVSRMVVFMLWVTSTVIDTFPMPFPLTALAFVASGLGLLFLFILLILLVVLWRLFVGVPFFLARAIFLCLSGRGCKREHVTKHTAYQQLCVFPSLHRNSLMLCSRHFTPGFILAPSSLQQSSAVYKFLLHKLDTYLHGGSFQLVSPFFPSGLSLQFSLNLWSLNIYITMDCSPCYYLSFPTLLIPSHIIRDFFADLPERI